MTVEPGGSTGQSSNTPAHGQDLASALLAIGVSAEEVAGAASSGNLPLLAIESLVLPDPATHDLDGLAAATGMPASQIAQFWRSLGFAEPRPGDRIFTSSDAEMLRTVAELIDMDVLDPELAVQMSRVIGSSLARVASAQVDAIDTEQEGDEEAEISDGGGVTAGPARRAAGGAVAHRRSEDDFQLYTDVLLPTLPKIMDYVWRRHLQAAARQRLNRGGSGGERDDRRAVGFADLVGFTALSQQIAPRELAAVVDRFETIAYDTVAQFGGWVVKMIGDEVMFSVDQEKPAVEIALTLAEAYADDDDLSDVRVGLASGPVLQREADLFGPVVNLAARITGIAFPASVVVGESVHVALAADTDLAWQAIGRRRLKDIGRVPLWVVRRASAPSGPKSPRDRARARQAEQRERTVDRMATTEHRSHHR